MSEEFQINRTVLNKATSPDSNPTPGYLFDEIAKVTFDPVSNDKLVDYLLKRLESPSPDVKIKVLLIIKNVCRKGDANFRRAFTRDSMAVKACLQFQAPPDPLRGDEPSRKCRETAKLALEAIFDNTRDEKKDPVLSGRIQGFGNSIPPPVVQPGMHHQQGGGNVPPPPPAIYNANNYASSSGVSGRYGGIGNPNFQDPRIPTEPKGILERVTTIVRDKVEKYAEAHGGGGGASGSYGGYSGEKPAWMTQNQAAPVPGYNFASNRYGGETQTYNPPSDNVVVRPTQQVWGGDPRSPKYAEPGGGGISANRAGKDDPNDRVPGLVNDLCGLGGVRPIPPKDKLDAFCKSCHNFDPFIVCNALEAKLKDADWKIQHKALCVWEAILEHEDLEAYADQLDQNVAPLEELYNSRNVSVKERALRVWKLLYEEAEAPASSSSFPNTEAKEVNLLETGDGNATANDTRKAAAPINLLEFDLLSGNGGNNNNNMFDFSNQSPPPTSGQGGGGMGDMFQNLNLKESKGGSNNNNNNNKPPAAVSSSFSFVSGTSNEKPAPEKSIMDAFSSYSTMSSFNSMNATTNTTPNYPPPMNINNSSPFGLVSSNNNVVMAPSLTQSNNNNKASTTPQKTKDAFSFLQQVIVEEVTNKKQ